MTSRQPESSRQRWNDLASGHEACFSTPNRLVQCRCPSPEAVAFHKQSIFLYEQYMELLRLRENIQLLESPGNSVRPDKLAATSRAGLVS